MNVTSMITQINSASPEKKKVIMDNLIKNGEEYGVYPVTNEQKRMLFLHDFLKDPCTYNSRFVIKVTSAEKADMVRKALENIVYRHEILRTIYFRINGTYFQVPCGSDEAEVPYDEIDLTEEYADNENEFIACINDMTNIPFDYTKDLPVRLLRVKATENLYFMLLTFHHIAIDGWSIGIIQDELNEYMGYISNGSEIILKEPEYQYVDYALWQKTDNYQAIIDECRDFWVSYLKKSEKQINLPFEKDCNKFENECVHYDCFLTEELTKKIRYWLKDTRKSLFNLMLSVFFIALFNFTEQDNINIGTPSANRNNEEFSKTIGYFANTVVINAVNDKELTFRKFIDNIEKYSYDVFQNQDFSIDMIVSEVCSDRTSFENSLFNVMYSVQNDSLINKGTTINKHYDITIEQFEGDKKTQYPLIFTVIDLNGRIRLALSYWKNKFSHRRIKILTDTMVKIISQVMENDSLKLKELPVTDIIEDIRKYEKIDTQKEKNEEFFISSISPEICDKIIHIWKNVTGCDKVDKNSKFFQIGGNSMNSIVVMQMINEEFGIDIKIDDLFKYTTVSMLASFVCSKLDCSEAENDDVVFASF